MVLEIRLTWSLSEPGTETDAKQGGGVLSCSQSGIPQQKGWLQFANACLVRFNGTITYAVWVNGLVRVFRRILQGMINPSRRANEMTRVFKTGTHFEVPRKCRQLFISPFGGV